MNIVSNINTDKATSGNIKSIIIKLGSKWCHDIIYRIVCQIWNERQRENARILNESNVVLLFKEGDRKEPGNYRPISLRHIILNILDKWIQKKLAEHFERNDAYQKQQYGFTP